MQLMVLNENFENIGPISAFRSLIWTRRYFDVGMFELHIVPKYFSILNQGTYLYRNDASELGLIEHVYYDIEPDSENTRTIYAKGYFAEGLLKRRVIEKTVTVTGQIEDAMRELVASYAINPAESGRKIAHLSLGDKCGLSGSIDTQVTGEELGEYLYTLCKDYGISIRIAYDYLTNDLKFEVWQGKDRRDSQNENSWAIFSDQFCNIRSAEYERDLSDYKNVAYVAGTGEGTERKVVEVDNRTDADEERRELYVDARDLQPEDDDGNTISDADYAALLTQRGLEKLARYQLIESASGDIDQYANLRYKTDYDLGDYVVYKSNEVGVATEQRITEITETWEGDSMGLSVTFGNEGVSTVRQLVKREAG